MPFYSTLLAVVALSGSALCSDFTIPAGYNFETSLAAGPVVGVLNDGRLLVSTGFFGADEISVVEADGSHALFATGFGSLAGVAQSPVTGDILVGDSLFTPSLTVLRDIDGNGDALGAGEKSPFTVQPGLLPEGLAPLPFSLSFQPGTDNLFMTGSTPFDPMVPTVGVVSRFSAGVETTFATGLGYPAGMVWDGEDLYVADLNASTFVGRILTLTDANRDGDARDAGEAVEFASGLSGANGLVRAADGSFYLSGVFDVLEGGDFSGCIARILPDANGDGVHDGFTEAYIDGFAFTGALTLIEGPEGFTPGAGGDGQLYIGDFSAPAGDRILTSAPHAATHVLGEVANNSTFQIMVSGEIGATAFSIISLDTSTTTIAGIGDLCLGFQGAFKVFAPQTIGPTRSVTQKIDVRDEPALIGLEVAIQGIVLEDGRYGLGNSLHFVVSP